MKPQSAAHRSGPLKQINKAHKTGRHRSKSQIDKESKGRTSLTKITKKNKRQMSRIVRKNRINQIRALSKDAVQSKKSSLGSAYGPPFLVTIVSLCEGQNVEFIKNLLVNCDQDSTSSTCERGLHFLNVPRYKQRFCIACPNNERLYDVMDCLKVSDTVVFLWPLDGELSDEAATLLTCLKAQGLPSYVNVVEPGFSRLIGKKKEAFRRSLTKNFEKWSLDTKFLCVESPSDALLLIRHIGGGVHKITNLQKHRPHLIAENVDVLDPSNNDSSLYRDLKISGYIRGPSLSVNALVHLTGIGDFQMKRIDICDDPRLLNINKRPTNKDVEMSDSTAHFLADPASREKLLFEVTPDPMEGEQTWPTEHDLQTTIESAQQKTGIVKKVPAGTSSYQAAWILDEDNDGNQDEDTMESDQADMESTSSSDSLVESAAEEESAEGPEDGAQFLDTESVAVTETNNTERYDVRFDEEEENAMLKRFREERENEQFPDEIDTPLDTPARIRFQRYRGLTSFRTSPWNPKENLPYDYARIFQFQDFRRTKKRALAESQNLVEGAHNGAYVSIYVENVPVNCIASLDEHTPLILYGMLPHEQKVSVLNVVLRKLENYTWPIKSKDNLVFHIGYRRFCAAPIFSQHTNGDKFKYERFMSAEVAVVASMYAPIMFPPCSALVFKVDVKGRHRLVAMGALLDVNPNRVVIKRLILSGHPFKINKRGAVVRHMFFNREDIDWFKPVELRTKYGRRGHIKEPLGTHGHMKCLFDRPINSQDTVLMDLYKRIFPKWTYSGDVPKPAVIVASTATASEIMTPVPEHDDISDMCE